MAGYTRQSTFADGDTITAALFNNEFNQLLNAFGNTSGHKHDGTANEGPVIGLIGDAGETSPNNKVLIDTTNNYIEFYVEVSSASVQQLYIADGAIIPVTDNDIDLGTSSLEFKDIYIDGTATIDTLTVDEAATVGTTLGVTGATTLSSTLAVTGATTLSSTLAVTGTSTLTGNVTATNDLSVGGNLTVTGNATISGNLTFGDADTDSINLAAEIDSHIVPNTDDTYDLGTSTKQWRNLYIDGTAEIDTLAIDGTTVTSTATELNILDGVTSTAAELNILDGVTSTTAELNILDGVTATAAEINLLDGVTSTTAELNILDGVTATAAEINLLDGVTSTTAELNILDGVTSTATELNIVDGDTAATSTTLADADRVVVNDAGTMKQVALTDFETYFEGALDTLSNVTTVGALNAGSITSGFGAIDNGSSAITTTGTVTYGSLSDGTITITAFVDEDDMSSNSATLVPTQQSVKAYVDTTVAATNEVVEDSTPQLGGNLDLNSNDITGTGNINITGTIQSSGNITGTLATAAQTNITSLGTLTTLTVDDITINGSTISDAGDLTLDVGGDIILNADGGDWLFYDGSTTLGSIQNDGNNNLVFMSNTNDKDIKFLGIDNTSTITALTLDMSNAGSATFNAGATFGGDVYASSYRKDGDSDTYLGFPAANQLALVGGDATLFKTYQIAGAYGVLEAHGSGSATYPNYTFNGDTNTGMYRATTDTLAFTTGSTERLRLSTSEAVVNEGSADYDFRVESNNNAHMLFVDGGNDHVNIGSATDRGGVLNVETVDNTATGVNISVGLDNGSASTPVALEVSNIGGTTSDGLYIYNAAIGGADRSRLLVRRTGASDNQLDLQLRDGSGNMRDRMSITNSEVIFNEPSLDMDFRVESDGNTHMLFVDGANNAVHVGGMASEGAGAQFNISNGSAETLEYFVGSGSNTNIIQAYNRSTSNYTIIDTRASEHRFRIATAELLNVTSAGVILNEDSGDRDFRVESNNNSHMLFVDGGNDVVCIGGSTVESGDHLEVLSSDTTTNVRIRNTNSGSAAPAIIFDKASGSPADDDEVGLLNFVGQDSNNNAEVYAQIVGIAADVTSGTEDGKLTLGTAVSGSFNTTLTITDGRVGIGESAPGSQLQITSNASGVNSILTVKNAISNRESRIQLLDESDQGGMVLNYDNGGNTATIQNAVNGALSIYLGGTGDANKLDDYEEGSFTAYVNDGTTSVSLGTAYYVKVGTFVSIYINGYNKDLSSLSTTGNLQLTNFPFTVSQAAPTSFGSNTPNGRHLSVHPGGTSSYIWMVDNNAVDFAFGTKSAIGLGTGSASIRGSFHYQTV